MTGARDRRGVMPAKAGIQYARWSRPNLKRGGYWIIRFRG
jgi:hypothetical protein